jgi:hypothetical protein
MMDGEIWVSDAWWHIDGLNPFSSGRFRCCRKFQVLGCEVGKKYLAVHCYCSGRTFLSIETTDMGKHFISVLTNANNRYMYTKEHSTALASIFTASTTLPHYWV